MLNPCPVPFNLADYVLNAGRATPDKVALSVLSLSRADRWSYARLIAAVGGTATGLLESGVTPGDRVLLRLGNTVDFPLAFLGAILMGAVPVPTSAQLTEPEVSHLIAEVSPSLILRDQNVACPPGRCIELEDFRRWRSLAPAQPSMTSPDNLAYIVFTSGTSGTPRAVCHAHRAIWARRMMWRDWYDLQPTDRLLHAGAFNWTYTLGTGLLDPWAIGATALIAAESVTHAQLPLLLKRHDATIFAAAPGVYRNILKSNLAAMPRLRHGLSAGEKLSETLRTRWELATGTPLYEAYGMSECSTFLSDKPGASAGLRAQESRTISLRDAGAAVADGTPGTIAVHRSDPGLMRGYLGPQTLTDARFDGDWFLTGDRAVRNPDGTYDYLGRDDDIMNAGGYRVSPLEVEAALARPDIDELAVTEVEVKQDVSVIAAFYVADSDLEAELRAKADATLARYKQPRLYIRRDTLPRGPNGKLQRRALAILPGEA